MLSPKFPRISGIAVWLMTVFPMFLQMAPATVVSIAGHSAILGNDGTLRLAGENGSGQLGTGDLIPRSVFVPQALPEWQAVWTGRGVTFARKSDGSLWACGDAGVGRLGVGGTGAGIQTSFVQVQSDTDWVEISAGERHTLGRKADGTLWVWGMGTSGTLGTGTTSTTVQNTPLQLGVETTWTASAAGNSHNLALKSDGSLWAWGSNSFGQLGLGTSTTAYSPARVGTLSGWAKISAGDNHSLAIRSDGSLWGWGLNASGQLGTGGGTASAPVRVGTANDWLSVSAGGTHSLALKTDGSLWAWGANLSGQLGLGDTLDRSTPVRVGTGNDWVSISAGFSHSAAVRSNGEVSLWGGNADGQLGIPGGNRLSPAPASLELLPDIRVTTPSGTKSETFPVTPAGAPVSKNFTIHNFGSAPLVISGISTPPGFAVTLQVPATLMPNQSLVVPTTLTAALGGAFSGNWSAASNDPDEPTSTVGLTGRVLSYETDGDGDGLSDAAEFKLASFGFHWDSPDPGLVGTLATEGHRAGLMSEAELRALRPGAPLLKADEATARAPFRLRLEKAASSLDFTPASVTGASVDDAGRVIVPQPRGAERAAFFRFSINPQP